MRVLSAHMGADTGGVGWGLVQAFRSHPTVELRSSVGQSNYIDYPTDLPWSEAPAYGRHADVLHLHNTFRTGGLLMLNGLPKVLHHHGTHYRENADRLNAEVRYAEAAAVVSTLDLLDYGPDLTWVPAAYDLATLPRRKPRPGPLRVGHAPTNRLIKSTSSFLAACAQIPGVEPVLIEQAPWRECLAAKATCDVYFDQVQLGYGCNAIEAWAMGIPVIAGGSDQTLARMAATFGQIPFTVADETTIGDAIKSMLDPTTRDQAALRGIAHVQRWHNGTETQERLTPIYEALCSTSATS